MAEVVDQESPLVKVLKSLPAEQAGELNEAIGRMVDRAVQAALEKRLPDAIDNFLEGRGYAPEIAGLVHLLAARSNDAKEGVLLKALTLYGLALDAREKGNHLAVLDPDDVILHEVIGFDPAEGDVQKAAG